jgi:hypothetical protein
MVLPDKRLISNKVSGTVELDTIEEISWVALNYHIAPATFNNDLKNLASLNQIQILCFDFDNGLITSKEVHEQLKNINHLILASKSHLMDKQDGKGIIERFHVFIPVNEAITDKDLYKFICKQIALKYKWNDDKAVIEASRYYFKHKAELFITNDMPILSIYGYKEAYELELTQRRYKASHIKSKVVATYSKEPCDISFNNTKAYRLLETGELAKDGNRYALSSQIIGVMIKCGIKINEALSLFDKYAIYGNNFTRNSIERRFIQWT